MNSATVYLVIIVLAAFCLGLGLLVLILAARIRNAEKQAETVDTEVRLSTEQEKLQLILDSTAEAIYGLDREGVCTFCNRSCLELLGYDDPTQLVGRKIHQIIHHSRRDGSLLPQSECVNLKTVSTGEKFHVDNEVYWRKDGSCFDVEYFSYPQYHHDKLIGAVVTFTDITESKRAEEKIQYLSYHDELTGLYNRRFFEAEMRRLDTGRNLPLAVIIGDVNALKLTNDIFGHEAGDKLLNGAAAAMRQACREDDIIARWGGDEFAILLPRTTLDQAGQICARIKEKFARTEIELIEGSISLGAAVKETSDDHFKRVMEIAEDRMYMRKTLERSDMACKLVKRIIDKIHTENPDEKRHALRVSALCREFARFVDLPDSESEILGKAGFLHDIGKIIIDRELRSAAEEQVNGRHVDMRQHPLIGFRILNFCEKTAAFAPDILQHHEFWDGNGYPKGLSGGEISRNARVITLAERYDRLTGKDAERPLEREQALAEIARCAGKTYDPEMAADFIRFIRDLPTNSGGEDNP